MSKFYKKIVALFLCTSIMGTSMQPILADEAGSEQAEIQTETIDNSESDEQKYVTIGDTQVEIDEQVLDDPQYYLYFDADGNRVDTFTEGYTLIGR